MLSASLGLECPGGDRRAGGVDSGGSRVIGFRIQGFKVKGLGFVVWVAGFGVWVFLVSSSGFGAPESRRNLNNRHKETASASQILKPMLCNEFSFRTGSQ